jgi:ACR3 family arsenite transporter
MMMADFGALRAVRRHVCGISVTPVRALAKPFSMAFLGWFSIRDLLAPMLPAAQLDGYIAGLILLAAAPGAAMVLAWSGLINGDQPVRLRLGRGAGRRRGCAD